MAGVEPHPRLKEARVDQAVFKDWLCRRLVAVSRDAIIFADQAGRIRLWNAGAEAMFGYAAGEVEGRTLDLIIPENLRARHNEGYRRVMASGASRYAAELLAVPGIRKDGARISLEFTITLIKDDGGEVLGAAAIVREVTARWQREQELKKRLAAMAAADCHPAAPPKTTPQGG
jgi:PAS domain S-box-containing protein